MSTTEATKTAEPGKLGLKVDISETGPCRRKVAVTIPEGDIAQLREVILSDFCVKTQVNGFRVGRVPRQVVLARFQQQLSDELKQRVLVSSLEQLTLENELDPINEPEMDVESIYIPATGDFTYSFEVEVRPDVQIPDYSKITIKRPTRQITDADIDKYIAALLAEYGKKTESEEPAAAGDIVTVDIAFTHGSKLVREMKNQHLRLLSALQFHDAELAGFDQLLAGVKAGETRTGSLMISLESSYVPMRGETLSVAFTVKSVSKFTPATLGPEFFGMLDVDDNEAFRKATQSVLERQVVYRQRQSCRTQLLEQMTESASWVLPESLVMKQVENALHRETLEMQQAGYTQKEINARESEVRQNAVSVTRQAMKEHFVLDKIATVENVEVTPNDIEAEIIAMAFQQGESPRRIRARLEKSGVIENLEAQIRERKAVDIALARTQFEEVPLEGDLVKDLTVEAIDDAVCNLMLARSLASTGA